MVSFYMRNRGSIIRKPNCALRYCATFLYSLGKLPPNFAAPRCVRIDRHTEYCVMRFSTVLRFLISDINCSRRFVRQQHSGLIALYIWMMPFHEDFIKIVWFYYLFIYCEILGLEHDAIIKRVWFVDIISWCFVDMLVVFEVCAFKKKLYRNYFFN